MFTRKNIKVTNVYTSCKVMANRRSIFTVKRGRVALSRHLGEDALQLRSEIRSWYQPYRFRRRLIHQFSLYNDSSKIYYEIGLDSTKIPWAELVGLATCSLRSAKTVTVILTASCIWSQYRHEIEAFENWNIWRDS